MRGEAKRERRKEPPRDLDSTFLRAERKEERPGSELLW